MFFVDDLGRSLRESGLMAWETFWPIVLGFGLSGVIQRFVPRETMEAKLGRHSPKNLVRASGYGVVSSSCSYAASAMTKSLFQKGADFIAALVFMIASTNLVVELGIVLLVLLGWQFLIGQILGGVVMIVIIALIGPVLFSKNLSGEIRNRLGKAGHEPYDGATSSHCESPIVGTKPTQSESRTLAAWSDASAYAISDLKMLRKELVVGYVVAGILATAVPSGFWRALFIPGRGLFTSIENALVGPLIAVISFVCSIGNVPLAASLWKGGISYGGVMSFVFADLIAFPLLAIYRKYYGIKATARIFVMFWLAMSLSGFVIGELFQLGHVMPSNSQAVMIARGFSWNYTSYLNIIFLLIFVALYILYRNQSRLSQQSNFAIDPICKMQVSISNAPASILGASGDYYFCSDGCKERFQTKMMQTESIDHGDSQETGKTRQKDKTRHLPILNNLE